jgi:hypothetical protein
MITHASNDKFYEDVRHRSDMTQLVEEILSVRAAISKIERQAAHMIGEHKKRLAQIERAAETSGAQWTADNLPNGKKSMDLLTGRVGFRRTPYKLEIAPYNTETAAEWCVAHLDNAVEKVETTKLKKKVIMKHFKATGELPPGVDLISPETKFYVTE